MMSDNPCFDIFISYRREGGETLGRLIFELLKYDYNVFFDHESLKSGRFDNELLHTISNAKDVIVLLTPGCFDRCVNKQDWFTREITHALKQKKNIILLMAKNFKMPDASELQKYPAEIRTLINYHGYEVDIAHIDSIIGKLGQELQSPKRETASAFDHVTHWHELSERLHEPKLSSLLPKELKSRILRGAVNAFLDEANAKIFTSLLDRMSGQTFNIRSKFQYEITINESFAFRGCQGIDADKYYELVESLVYRKEFLKGMPERSFWLSFTTSLDELDETLRNETFFFSENLMMDREDIRLLSELDDGDKRKFYLSSMRTRININNQSLEPCQVIIDESGIFARYELPEEILQSPNVLDVKIHFRIPQKIGDGYFFASISEPTFSPFIRFDYPDDAFEVTMIPFLTHSISAKDTRVFDGQCEFTVENEWVLPVSGAIFLIKKIDNA